MLKKTNDINVAKNSVNAKKGNLIKETQYYKYIVYIFCRDNT